MQDETFADHLWLFSALIAGFAIILFMSECSGSIRSEPNDRAWQVLPTRDATYTGWKDYNAER